MAHAEGGKVGQQHRLLQPAVPLLVTAVLAAAGAYSYVAAGTRPFTGGADAVTAAPFAVVLAVMTWSLLRRRRRPRDPAPARAAPGGSVLPWVGVAGALVLWELVTYVAGFSAGRHAFPTISSLVDDAFRYRGAKTALFAAWLALGWGLVRR